MLWFKFGEKKKIKKVRKDGLSLKEITKHQTHRICLEAVKQNGLALRYVKQQTETICLEAIKQNPNALGFAKNKSFDLCLMAVKQRGESLIYIVDQRPELCLEAVKQDGSTLKHVKDQTLNICFEAVKQNGYALVYSKISHPRLYLEASKSDSLLLMRQWIYDEETLLSSLLHFPKNFRAIKHPTDEMRELHERLSKLSINSNTSNDNLYRLTRLKIANGEINSQQSPYHVLEQLYG